ncbi:hypothetical protein BJY01DRAFT_210667 [Aspergillus pseudoustus]|uniref:Uncharacterized protein n=1 Tax=Aspergillus pseudoustus TaxID=1810923 RepID=A0ABR4KBF1_9EURO
MRILKRPAGEIVPTCGLSSMPACNWTETEERTLLLHPKQKATDSYFGNRRPPKKKAQVSAANDDPARSPSSALSDKSTHESADTAKRLIGAPKTNSSRKHPSFCLFPLGFLVLAVFTLVFDRQAFRLVWHSLFRSGAVRPAFVV